MEMSPLYFVLKAIRAPNPDLFSAPVEVAGYVTKRGGYVAPHSSTRMKAREAAQGDLFGGAEPAKPAPKPARKPVEGQADLFSAPPAPPAAPAVVEEKPSGPLLGGLPDDAELVERGGKWLVRIGDADTALYATQREAADAARAMVARQAQPGKTGQNLPEREQLTRLRGKLDLLVGELAARYRHASTVAEAWAKRDEPGRAHFFGRGTSAWTKRAESVFQAKLAELLAKEAPSLRATIAKFDRGMSAQTALASRLGANEPWAPEGASSVETVRAALDAKPAPAEDIAPSKRAEPSPAKPGRTGQNLEFGVRPGVKKAERKRLNAAAIALLNSKADAEMTPEDKQVLARYSGTGQIGASLNEFYTQPDLAGAMWKMLEACGFQGGEVLEPSCGTGVFLHTAPVGARVMAVELDGISSRIARILHGPNGHEVANASLEGWATVDGRKFDAVIGNPPFGPRGGTVKDDKDDLPEAAGYFTDTALDKAKDGGLVALILPTGIMDSVTNRGLRERLMRKGEFIGAHRLPNTAFDAAHTAVTTDIVLFRKRPQEIAGALSALNQEQLQAVGVWDQHFLAGTYFTDGPGQSRVMGTMEAGWRARAGLGHDITVSGSMQGVPAALAAWRPEESEAAERSPDMGRILDAVGKDERERARVISASRKPPYQQAHVGDVKVINGVRYVLQGDPPRWHKTEDSIPKAVKDAQAVAELLDGVKEGRGHRMRRAQLQEALDVYIREHGIPSQSKDLLRWLDAPSMPMEEGTDQASHAAQVKELHRKTARLLGAVNSDGSYSDLVTGRQVERQTGTLDEVATKLALEVGAFTADKLAAETGKSRDEVIDHLFGSADYALDPDGVTWTTLDAYASGDLWPKYDAALAASTHEGLGGEYRTKYARQADQLLAAIGPQSLEDVGDILPTSGFVTPADLSAWFNDQREAFLKDNPKSQWAPSRVEFSYADGWYSARALDKSNYGYTALPHGVDLLLKMLNRDGVRKDDKPQVDQLNKDFRDWLLTSDRRQEVEDRYNRTYRGFRPKAYSDAPIHIEGLNPALDVNSYHYSGIRWAVEAGSGIIAADVGLGKTGRALMMARLAVQNGSAKKPTFVVPKSVLANWLREAEFWFPGSKVLAIGETVSTNAKGEVVVKPDDEETRRRKFHELQQNNYDFVFISAPTWDGLDVSPDKRQRYSDNDFWTQRAASKDGVSVNEKKLNEARTRHDQKEASKEFKKREETIYFDELGIDMLIMDEGHGYKNLVGKTRNRYGLSPKFLGGSGESKRARDTFFKTTALRESTGGRGVFMLTATPTKNSPLEIYSMLCHIAPESFDRMGIKNAEDFIDRFVEFKEGNILTVTGEIEEALITAGFKNLGELREVMKRYIDRKTAADVGLKLPGRDDRTHLVDMSGDQERIYQELRQAAADSGGKDATGDAHIFSIMDKMGKAALDLELLGHKAPGFSPKTEALAEEVSKGVQEGGQVIFCEAIGLHDKIARALVAKGIPREQIGIFNAQTAKSSDARQKLSDAFNAGKLKAIIGNKSMEEGVNLQKATTDIHHMDIPWEPGTVQQRNGRGLRQGNKKEAVRIHTYLSKGSFDGYRWQTLLSKRDWQDLLWNGGDRVENLLQEGKMGRDELLIALSADPEAAREKYEGDKAAALQRKLVEERGQAIEQFAKLRKMRASLAEMQAKGKTGETVFRLAQKVDKLDTALRASREFTHKFLLDGNHEALIEPVTNTVYQKGSAFEVTPGPDAPVTTGDAPTRWVVETVDTDNGIVWARPYASLRFTPLGVKVDAMKSGVTPFEYSEKDEQRALDDLAAKAAEAKHADIKKIDDVVKLAPAIVARMAPAIQQQLKAAARGYEASYYGHVGMIDPQGNPVLKKDYALRPAVDTHDFILPIPEHREKAIAAYVDLAKQRRIETSFQQLRRGKTGNANGVKSAYPGFEPETQNPWAKHLVSVHGKAALSEANDRVEADSVAGIGEAQDMKQAMTAALPSVWTSDYGGGEAVWPTVTLRALHAKAKALGVLDQSIEHFGDHKNGYASQLNSHGGTTDYPKEGRDWRGKTPPTTIGAFLRRRAPDGVDLEAAPEPAKPGAGAVTEPAEGA